MRFQHILFDLDGTLTDPAEGICASVIYALRRAGRPAGPPEEYYKFIGPPLLESFSRFCEADDDEARTLLKYYRERFSVIGLYENRVYPGIPELLKELKDAGAELMVATSKPEVYCQRILDRFGLAEYFDFIAGSELDGTRVAKVDVIAYALEQCGLTNDLGYCLMVGDREYDVLGARSNGIACAGVLYGYGSREELQKAGAAFIAETVDDLHAFLLR